MNLNLPSTLFADKKYSDGMTTRSLCNECYNPIPATIERRDDTVFLIKECGQHGQQEAMIESSYEFWQDSHGSQLPKDFNEHFDTCMISVTDHCNVSCPHCYHIPGKGQDPKISSILKLVKRTKNRHGVILMGAEPTVRDDLPEIIKTIKEEVGCEVYIYSNGVRLAYEEYTQSLIDAGLDGVCFSLHMRDYTLKSYTPHWQFKKLALKVLKKKRVYIDHIAFSMRTIEDLNEIFQNAHDHWLQPDHFRIRIPAKIGICKDKPIFLSEFITHLTSFCKGVDWSLDFIFADNNPYHMMCLINGKSFRIIRWPSVEEVDLGELECPPSCLFVPKIGEVNFVHGALVHAALRSSKIKLSDLKVIR